LVENEDVTSAPLIYLKCVVCLRKKNSVLTHLDICNPALMAGEVGSDLLWDVKGCPRVDLASVHPDSSSEFNVYASYIVFI
jgi:hypothetical protein